MVVESKGKFTRDGRERGVILGKVSFWAVREATRASFSFWVGPGGRAGCGTGLAAGDGVTTAGGDTICSRDLLTKARYCSLVSFGGVDTGKSNIEGERGREEKRREERKKSRS